MHPAEALQGAPQGRGLGINAKTIASADTGEYICVLPGIAKSESTFCLLLMPEVRTKPGTLVERTDRAKPLPGHLHCTFDILASTENGAFQLLAGPMNAPRTARLRGDSYDPHTLDSGSSDPYPRPFGPSGPVTNGDAGRIHQRPGFKLREAAAGL